MFTKPVGRRAFAALPPGVDRLLRNAKELAQPSKINKFVVVVALIEPGLDPTTAVSQVPANSVGRRAFAALPPGVDRPINSRSLDRQGAPSRLPRTL